MEISLDGKVALVTGAGPNIGSGIALALSRYGARVACNDIDLDAAKAAVRRIERNGGVGLALSGDVSVEADVLANIGAVLEAWDRIDIVINNAAWLHACGLLEEDLASFNRAITIAVNGNFLYTKYGALAMIERGIKGSIVLGAGQRGLAAVLASRAAGAGTIIVTGLSRDAGKLALAREFGADVTIDVEAEDTVARVAEVTGGAGADVALELTPMAAQPIRDALQAVRWGGRVVLAGLKGGQLVELSTDVIINKALTVMGAFSVDSRAYAEAIRLIETGRFPLARMHTHSFGLSDVSRAIETLAGEVPGEDAVHVAIVPGLSEPRGAAADGARELVSGALRFTARAAWFDAEQRLAASAASGVDAEVVSPFPPLLNYLLPAAYGRDLARWVNEYIAGLCAAAPGRIYGLGTVPLQDPDLAAGELGSVVGQLGLAGVEIASGVGGLSLADERFLGFFAEAERLGAAIFVHAMPVPSDRLPRPATATFGVGVEGSLAAAALITGGVAEKYPGLRLAFSHGAGGFPLMLPRAQWFWGRTWNEEPPGERGPEAAPWAAAAGPAELARRFYYDSLVFDRRAIRYLIDMIGPERLLVGSDFPAMPREQPAGRTLRSMGLPDSVLDDITWHNGFRFLGLSEPEGSGKHNIDARKLFSSRE